jgi:preprotein translocase subunit YajC
MEFLSLLAMASPQAAQGAQPNQFLAFLPIVFMFVIFYFLLIRPQQKRQKELAAMLSQLKKGDQVVTSGGIIGTIVGVKEKEVVLKVGDDGVKLEFLRSAISQVIKS